MEQIEIAYPLSLKMTDKEFDAVVRYNLCHYYLLLYFLLTAFTVFAIVVCYIVFFFICRVAD